MSPVPRHPNKDIRKAIKRAETMGWTVEKSKGKGHRWGVLRCGGGYAVRLDSTPRNPSSIAKRVDRVAQRCVHLGER